MPEMVFDDAETDALAGALQIVHDPAETALNAQGGYLVLELPALAARRLAQTRAEHSRLDAASAAGLEYQAATAFLASQIATNKALDYARSYVDTPVVMYGDVRHSYVVPGEKPKEPAAYRTRLQIGKKPFA